jgi:hypothetical protein
METLHYFTQPAERYGDVPLGEEASVLHLVRTESNDHEDRAEPREVRSLDAWRG